MLKDLEVEVHDWLQECCGTVMVALDGEDGGTLIRLCRLQNDLIRNIPAGEQDIGLPGAVFPLKVINIGKNQQFHFGCEDQFL